ncbi:MAG: thymidine phosphorylase family protein [Dehalococcoidia bacterium]|nr:thymidine phosphorylase family protein [Dehalococcoidia bacterium]
MTHELRRLGIDTSAEHVAFLSADELLCQCLGLHPLDRVEITSGERRMLAILNGVTSDLLPLGTVGVSDAAFRHLGVADGESVEVRPADPPASSEVIRRKVAGEPLAPDALDALVRDIADGRHSKVELTAFVVASTIHGLSNEEVLGLIRATVASGEQLQWDAGIVADKHSIGGIPGNRTTPIVVAIAAAAGLTVPKTSSRAVTSPAGTADTVETLMDVTLPPQRLREVVAQAGACLAWGGAFRLAPADDVIIQVERPLAIDCEGLMLSSILAKKVAAGATHVVIDVPVGPGAKVTDGAAARRLAERFSELAAPLGLTVSVEISQGRGPIGRGVGPALEARDVLAVLRGEASAPTDLRLKGLALAGRLLESAGAAAAGQGREHAAALLESGAAYERFERIRDLQGRRELPAPGPATFEWHAPHAGRVHEISNAAIARAARLAGAPRDVRAGIDLLAAVGDEVSAGEALFRVHSQSPVTLGFAVDYLQARPAAPVTVLPT